MIFEYRDEHRKTLRINRVEPDRPGQHVDPAIWIAASDGGWPAASVHIPLDRVEEVIAGIRDTARTASGQQPETCCPVDVDGTTVLVRGHGDWTETDQQYMAEIVAAAKRKYEAEHPACACTHPQDRHLSACTECPCVGYAPTWPPQKRRITPVCDQCGTPWTDGHTCADPTTADDPTPLRWGLGDVLWGDDDTVIVCLSGPAPDRAPYWLELDAERAAALRDDLAGPDRPAVGLPISVCPDCNDSGACSGVCFAGPAVGQPAEAQATDRSAALHAAADRIALELTPTGPAAPGYRHAIADVVRLLRRLGDEEATR